MIFYAEKASTFTGHADDPPSRILAPVSQPLKQSATAHTEPEPEPPLDPPPSYSPPSYTRLAPPAPPAPRACNHLSLHRTNSAIRGTYTIDPALRVPPFLLPPRARGESERGRKNLRLETANGEIDAEVVVLGRRVLGDGAGAGAEAEGARRTKVDVRASNGAVSVRLNAPAGPRDAVHLTARASNGSMTILLPRSFTGLVASTAGRGRTDLTGALAARATVFSELSGTMRCFVGELAAWAEGVGEGGEGGWVGDEVGLVAGNGSVRIGYVDEVLAPLGRGFFGGVVSPY